jgi:hypothetical protein
VYLSPGIPSKQELCHAAQGIHATVTSRFFERIIVFAVGRSGTADARKDKFAANEQICPDRDSNDYVQKYPVFKIWRLFGK